MLFEAVGGNFSASVATASSSEHFANTNASSLCCEKIISQSLRFQLKGTVFLFTPRVLNPA